MSTSPPHLAALREYVREKMGELEPVERTAEERAGIPAVLLHVWAAEKGFHRVLARIDRELDEVEKESMGVGGPFPPYGWRPPFSPADVLFIIAVAFYVLVV